MFEATGVIMNGSSAVRSPQGDAGKAHESRDVRIPPIGLPGTVHVPKRAYALVAFAHGSGSSRLSPRNTAVASALNTQGIATLLFDLLTPSEEADRANVFNIPLLADRLVDAVHWLDGEASVAKLPLGLFGASTGAAAALVAAAKLPRRVGAVVVPGASHLFPEPGALEAVIGHAANWLVHHLAPSSARRPRMAGEDQPKRQLCHSRIAPMPVANWPRRSLAIRIKSQ
jgi:putative phosphoribosyl transferase